LAEERETGLVRTQSPTPLTVTVIQVPAEVVMYNVSEQDLDNLVDNNPSLHFGFLGLSLGALISFGLTLLTTTLGDKLFATFVALTALSGFLSIYFGVRSAKEWHIVKQRLERIKARRGSQ